MDFQSEINKVENILKGRFTSQDDKMFWENKLLDLKQRQYNARENEKILKKAGYVGDKY